MRTVTFRYYLVRFKRKGKYYNKKIYMVEKSLNLLTNGKTKQSIIYTRLRIFKFLI